MSDLVVAAGRARGDRRSRERDEGALAVLDLTGTA